MANCKAVRVDPDTEFLNALGAENAMSDFVAARQAALYSGNEPLLSKQGKAGLDAAPAVLERLGRLRDQVVSQAPPSRRRDLQFRGGKPNGFGMLKNADGDVFSGTWTNGCFRQGDRKAWALASAKECGFE